MLVCVLRLINKNIVLGIGNIQCEPKLFGRWQQQCGLSLSILQQLVNPFSLKLLRIFNRGPVGANGGRTVSRSSSMAKVKTKFKAAV